MQHRPHPGQRRLAHPVPYSAAFGKPWGRRGLGTGYPDVLSLRAGKASVESADSLRKNA